MADLYAITGFPGVGKYTVATELVRRIEAGGETVRLVDNHYVNNPIFGLVEQDGVTSLPAEVWHRVHEVGEAVLKTVETLTPTDWHLVFTLYVGPEDGPWVDRLVDVARARGSTFVPVRLLCDPEENARRIVMPERRDRMKSADAGEPYRLTELGPPFASMHPNELTLDVTQLAATEAATAILAHTTDVHGQR